MDPVRFGRQFRALRVRARRRQLDVAARAHVSRSLVAAIDRGQLDGVTIGAIVRAAAALGAEVDLRLRYRGEQLDRLLDEDHALLVDRLVRLLTLAGWTVEVEASFSIWGERGSIDLLTVHPRSGALLVVEAKSVVPDSQEMLHRLDQKVRLAPVLAKERGWSVQSVSRLLVIADTSTSRRRIARLASTYDVAMPARGAAVRRWLSDPTGRLAGILLLPDDSLRTRPLGRERVNLPRPISSSVESPPHDSRRDF